MTESSLLILNAAENRCKDLAKHMLDLLDSPLDIDHLRAHSLKPQLDILDREWKEARESYQAVKNSSDSVKRWFYDQMAPEDRQKFIRSGGQVID